MSLFLREIPFFESSRSLLHNSIFDDENNEEDDYGFLHALIPDKRSIRHPRHLLLRNLHRHANPYKTLEKQLTKALKKDNEVFHLVDFRPKINISEDENNYYLHADLPGMTKDQVKMEITEDHTFILSGERKSVRKEGNLDKKDEVKKEEKIEEKEEKDSKIDKKNKKSKKNVKSKAKDTEVKKEKDQNPTKEKSSLPKHETNNEKFSLMECSYGKFKRSFTLPEDVDLDQINAKMMNGVLKVTFQKITPTKKDQTRTIHIN